MRASHVAGGGLGVVLGAILAGALRKFAHLAISDVDAAAIGSAALAAGAGLGHAVSVCGIRGVFSILWSGERKARS